MQSAVLESESMRIWLHVHTHTYACRAERPGAKDSLEKSVHPHPLDYGNSPRMAYVDIGYVCKASHRLQVKTRKIDGLLKNMH